MREGAFDVAAHAAARQGTPTWPASLEKRSTTANIAPARPVFLDISPHIFIPCAVGNGPTFRDARKPFLILFSGILERRALGTLNLGPGRSLLPSSFLHSFHRTTPATLRQHPSHSARTLFDTPPPGAVGLAAKGYAGFTGFPLLTVVFFTFRFCQVLFSGFFDGLILFGPVLFLAVCRPNVALDMNFCSSSGLKYRAVRAFHNRPWPYNGMLCSFVPACPSQIRRRPDARVPVACFPCVFWLHPPSP